METILTLLLLGLALYLALGILFAIYFAFVGAPKIDPLLGASKKSVRFLLLPGVVTTWPFLLKSLLKSKK